MHAERSLTLPPLSQTSCTACCVERCAPGFGVDRQAHSLRLLVRVEAVLLRPPWAMYCLVFCGANRLVAPRLVGLSEMPMMHVVTTRLDLIKLSLEEQVPVYFV